MLCRTANDLYWVARNMERAENTARLLDMAQRIALLPERLDRGKAQAAPWRRALDALGLVPAFLQHHERIDAEGVVHHLLLSSANPGSIFSCLRAARENARAQRVAITSEMYEDLNSSWLEIRHFDATRLRQDGLSGTLDWVKTRSAAFRGITIGTLGRGEGYQFLQMGAFIERAEWSIRLLDMIASDEELPETGEARDATQYFQWSALLQALSAFETYRRLYRESVSPAGVSTLMLLNGDNPRSLQSCVGAIHRILQSLAGDDSLEVVRQAGALTTQSRYARIDEIIAGGLESWLQDAMHRITRLGNEIHGQFMSTEAPPPRPGRPAADAMADDDVTCPCPATPGTMAACFFATPPYTMTYCIGLNLDDGLVLASDSRTNAGVDHIRRAGKMRVFAQDGERVVVTLSSGNLSLTQNVLNLIEHRARHEPERTGILNAQSMFQVAQVVGDAMREIRGRDEAYLRDGGIDPSGSFIVGGQIKGEAPRLFLVYSEGNFIESSGETPFFQTGEIKFGKPILDRVIKKHTDLVTATKCALVSFDSTIRSNLSVGLPIDMLVYKRDSLKVEIQQRFEDGDAYLQSIRSSWNDSMRHAVADLPLPDWAMPEDATDATVARA